MDEKAKILIVEDERIIAMEMRYKLESMGYDVSAIVSSGEEAVRKAEELHPDLVLMDIILQGEMDGVEAACQIKNRFGIPVVYVTANVSDARLEDITRSEPFGCLFKPFEDMELQAAVKMALYKYQMGKELKKSERMLRLITENMQDLVFMIDLNGNVQYTAPSIKRILGYEIEERIGRPTFEIVHPEDIENVMAIFANAIATSTPGKAEYRVKHADGHYIWVEAIGDFVFDDNGQAVGGILNIRDITDRMLAKEKIAASLREKETMLKEIHHRVKNNLQVISSLLGLQSSYLQDEESRAIFQESQERVRVMADIHTMLYQSADLARVDFGGFFRDLAGHLQQSYGLSGSSIEIHADMADVSLPIGTSIPCGLILNELLSNALKHAFPEGREGRVTVSMKTARDRFVLKVQDNGIGFPAATDFQHPQSLGLELVKLLVEQINGTIDLRIRGGTTFTITFPATDKRG